MKLKLSTAMHIWKTQMTDYFIAKKYRGKMYFINKFDRAT